METRMRPKASEHNIPNRSAEETKERDREIEKAIGRNTVIR